MTSVLDFVRDLRPWALVVGVFLLISVVSAAVHLDVLGLAVLAGLIYLVYRRPSCYRSSTS